MCTSVERALTQNLDITEYSKSITWTTSNKWFFFDYPIMLRSIWTRLLKENVLLLQQSLTIMRHTFFLIMRPLNLNTRRNLYLNVSYKSLKSGTDLILRTKKIYPSLTIEIINEGHKVCIIIVWSKGYHVSNIKIKNLKTFIITTVMNEKWKGLAFPKFASITIKNQIWKLRLIFIT